MQRIQCHEIVRFPERLELIIPINMAGSHGMSRYVPYVNLDGLQARTSA
jgi:hypothetical protein